MYGEIMEFVKGKIANNGRFSQPFRDRFEHTMRVCRWVERLHLLEGGNLRVLRLAALFHDVGWSDKWPHEQVSAEIARDYLTSHGYSDVETEKVVQAVAHHNHRTQEGPFSSETLILMDADMLDELGALTVRWDSMATALENDPSYLKVYERIAHYSRAIKDRSSLLKTESGRHLYIERIQFIEYFLDNLRFELGLEHSG